MAGSYPWRHAFHPLNAVRNYHLHAAWGTSIFLCDQPSTWLTAAAPCYLNEWPNRQSLTPWLKKSTNHQPQPTVCSYQATQRRGRRAQASDVPTTESEAPPELQIFSTTSKTDLRSVNGLKENVRAGSCKPIPLNIICDNSKHRHATTENSCIQFAKTETRRSVVLTFLENKLSSIHIHALTLRLTAFPRRGKNIVLFFTCLKYECSGRDIP